MLLVLLMSVMVLRVVLFRLLNRNLWMEIVGIFMLG